MSHGRATGIPAGEWGEGRPRDCPTTAQLQLSPAPRWRAQVGTEPRHPPAGGSSTPCCRFPRQEPKWEPFSLQPNLSLKPRQHPGQMVPDTMVSTSTVLGQGCDTYSPSSASQKAPASILHPKPPTRKPWLSQGEAMSQPRAPAPQKNPWPAQGLGSRCPHVLPAPSQASHSPSPPRHHHHSPAPVLPHHTHSPHQCTWTPSGLMLRAQTLPQQPHAVRPRGGSLPGNQGLFNNKTPAIVEQYSPASL